MAGLVAKDLHFGLVRSMSRKGCSPDNAACEGFFGRLKNEMYYGRNWSGVALDDFMKQVDDYFRWYNGHRIKLSLGAVSPETYRQRLGLIQSISPGNRPHPQNGQ